MNHSHAPDIRGALHQLTQTGRVHTGGHSERGITSGVRDRHPIIARFSQLGLGTSGETLLQLIAANRKTHRSQTKRPDQPDAQTHRQPPATPHGRIIRRAVAGRGGRSGVGHLDSAP